MAKAIVLCGFMSSGKTTVGRALSRRLGYRFADTDEIIVENQGKSIPQIFEEGGEALFRDLEHEVAKEAAAFTDTVISTGGGMMVFPRNVDALRATTVVAYLDSSFEDCYARMDKSGRPLVKNRSKEEVRELYDSRCAAYLSACHLHIRRDGRTVEETVDDIIAALNANGQ